jgi:LysR family hydrogen peroxide-inducible transcriptional activator
MEALDCLSVRDLRALVLLAHVRHYGHAADMMGISQPSLSAIVKKAERATGRTLFHRGRQGCEATAEGEAVLAAVAEALRRLDAIQEPEANRPPLTGTFRLGVIPTLGPYFLPRFLEAFLAAYPKMRLVLVEAMTKRLLGQLRRQTVDAALVSLPLHEGGFAEAPLLFEELMLAVPTAHPLAGREQVTLDDVRAEEVILLEPGHCLREDTLEQCGLGGPKDGAVHATSLETLRLMVRAGVGSAFMPRFAVEGREDEPGVRYLRFPAPSPTRTIGIASLAVGDPGGDVAEFTRFMRRTVGQEGSTP